jgi:hypothetical protein
MNIFVHYVCLYVSGIDDEMVQEFEHWINSEKVLLDYTIKRVLDNPYLQWK